MDEIDRDNHDTIKLLITTADKLKVALMEMQKGLKRVLVSRAKWDAVNDINKGGVREIIKVHAEAIRQDGDELLADALVAVLGLVEAGGQICDGCNVREPWEHKCHGNPIQVRGEPMDVACACEECAGADRHLLIRKAFSATETLGELKRSVMTVGHFTGASMQELQAVYEETCRGKGWEGEEQE